MEVIDPGGSTLVIVTGSEGMRFLISRPGISFMVYLFYLSSLTEFTENHGKYQNTVSISMLTITFHRFSEENPLTFADAFNEFRYIILPDYDQVGRLAKVTDQSAINYEYSYDTLGNCLATFRRGDKRTFSKYDWAGRLVNFNGKPCTHDDAGNLTSLNKDGKITEFSYTPDGQLQSAGNAVQYQYDGDGFLIERKVEGLLTKFVNNPLAGY